MGINELFATCSFWLKSPPRSKARFGTRRLYVDLPWQSYASLQAMMDRSRGHRLTTRCVREEWSRFLLRDCQILEIAEEMELFEMVPQESRTACA